MHKSILLFNTYKHDAILKLFFQTKNQSVFIMAE